jgi:SAM-dependent methyltransferase
MSDSIRQLTLTETVRGYDRWARSYDHTQNSAIAMASWLLDHQPLGCANDDVIELGCGTGRNRVRVFEEGARSYTGVDGSTGMLDVARATTAADRPVEWIVGNLLEPWTPPRTYDLALVILVLEHLPDLGVLAANAARAVRPGGRLRIIDLHHDRLAAGSIAQFDDADGTQTRFASVAHPTKAVVETLDAAGFEVRAAEIAASDALIAAAPRVAKHRGMYVMIDIEATRLSQ